MSEQSDKHEMHLSPTSSSFHRPRNHDQDVLPTETPRQPPTCNVAHTSLTPTPTSRQCPNHDQTIRSSFTPHDLPTSQKPLPDKRTHLALTSKSTCKSKQSHSHCIKRSSPTSIDPQFCSSFSVQSSDHLGEGYLSSSISLSYCPHPDNVSGCSASPAPAPSTHSSFQDSTTHCAATSHSVMEVEHQEHAPLCSNIPPSFIDSPGSAEVDKVHAPSFRHQIFETSAPGSVYTSSPLYAPPPMLLPSQSPAQPVGHLEVHQASDRSSSGYLFRGIPCCAPSLPSLSDPGMHSYSPPSSDLNEDSLAYAIHAQDIARKCAQLPPFVQECSNSPFRAQEGSEDVPFPPEEVLGPPKQSPTPEPQEGSSPVTFLNHETHCICSTFSQVPYPVSAYQQVSAGAAHDQLEGNCSSLRRDFPALFDVLHQEGKCPTESFPGSPAQSFSTPCSVPWAQHPQYGTGLQGHISHISRCAAFHQTCPEPLAWSPIAWNQHKPHCSEGSSSLLCFGDNVQRQKPPQRVDLLHAVIVSRTHKMALPTQGTFIPVTATAEVSDPSAVANTWCYTTAATYDPHEHMVDQKCALNHSLQAQGFAAETEEFHPDQMNSMKSQVHLHEPAELHSTATKEVLGVHHNLHLTKNKQGDSAESKTRLKDSHAKLRHSSLGVHHPNSVCHHHTKTKSQVFTYKGSQILSTTKRNLRLHQPQDPTAYKPANHKTLKMCHRCTKGVVLRNKRNYGQINNVQVLASNSIPLSDFCTLICSLSEGKAAQTTSSSSSDNKLPNKSSSYVTSRDGQEELPEQEDTGEQEGTANKKPCTYGQELHMTGNVQRMFHTGEVNVLEVLQVRGNGQQVLQEEENTQLVLLEEDGNVQQVIQEEDSNVQQVLQEEDSNVQQVIQEEDSNVQQVIQEEDRNVQQVIQEEDSNVQQVIQEEDSNVQQVIQEEDSNVQQVLQEEDSNVQQVLQEEDRNVQQVLQEEDRNVQQVLQEEENVQQVLQEERNVQQVPQVKGNVQQVFQEEKENAQQVLPQKEENVQQILQEKENVQQVIQEEKENVQQMTQAEEKNAQRQPPLDGEDHQQLQIGDEIRAQKPSDEIHLRSVESENMLLVPGEIRGQPKQPDETMIQLGKPHLSSESPSLLKNKPLSRVLKKWYIHGQQPTLAAFSDSDKYKTCVATSQELQGHAPVNQGGSLQTGMSAPLTRPKKVAKLGGSQSAVSKAELLKNCVIVMVNKPRTTQASADNHTHSQGSLFTLPKTAADKYTHTKTQNTSKPPSEYTWHKTTVSSSALTIHTSDVRRVDNENPLSERACQRLKSAGSAVYPASIISAPKIRRVGCSRSQAEETDEATRTLSLILEAADNIGDIRPTDTMQPSSSFLRRSHTVHLEAMNTPKSQKSCNGSDRNVKRVHSRESSPVNYDSWGAALRGQRHTVGICKPAETVRSKADAAKDFPIQSYAPRRSQDVKNTTKHGQAKADPGQDTTDDSSGGTEIIYCSPGTQLPTNSATATRKKQIQEKQCKIIDDERQLKKIMSLYKETCPTSSEDSTGTRAVTLKSRVKGLNGLRLLSEGEKKRVAVQTLRKFEKVCVVPI